MTTDVLLVGQGLWPSDLASPSKRTSPCLTPFPTLRLWQALRALRAADLRVVVATEPLGAGGTPTGSGSSPSRPARHTLGDGQIWFDVGESGLSPARVSALCASLRPACVVSMGPFRPAAAAAGAPPGVPVWIDLPGDPMAEAQLRAGEGVQHLVEYHRVLTSALSRGDAFGVCSPPQRHALLGQLGLIGRLTPEVVGIDPVVVMPPGVEPSWLEPAGRACPVPGLDEGGHIALLGSTNTWADLTTAVAALDVVLTERPEVQVVITGGAVPGFSESLHEDLLGLISARPWASRVNRVGWLAEPSLLALLDSCSVALSLDKPCLEAELGARTRLLVGVARGLRWVLTPSSHMSRQLTQAGGALGVRPGDSQGAARALGEALDLGSIDADVRVRLLETMGAGQGVDALVRWARTPRTWPGTPPEMQSADQQMRLLAETELAHVHGSKTWRVLELLRDVWPKPRG